MALPVDTQKFRFRENGRKIRSARWLTGLSQENFAPQIGTGRRHLIKLENGEHRPSGPLRDRIVEVTGTEDQIESSDDEEDEDLSVDGYVLTLTGRTTQDAGHEVAEYLLRGIQRDVRRLRQIEKALG